MDLPKRKGNRLKEYDYSADGAYFITVCTKNRRHILSKVCVVPNEYETRVGADTIRPQYRVELTGKGKIVDEAINNISLVYENIVVDKYVIMPNHIHIIIFINRQAGGRMVSAPTRSVVIGQMKRYASKIAGESLWQKSFYDHIIRGEADYLEKRQYI